MAEISRQPWDCWVMLSRWYPSMSQKYTVYHIGNFNHAHRTVSLIVFSQWPPPSFFLLESYRADKMVGSNTSWEPDLSISGSAPQLHTLYPILSPLNSIASLPKFRTVLNIYLFTMDWATSKILSENENPNFYARRARQLKMPHPMFLTPVSKKIRFYLFLHIYIYIYNTIYIHT